MGLSGVLQSLSNYIYIYIYHTVSVKKTMYFWHLMQKIRICYLNTSKTDWMINSHIGTEFTVFKTISS